jgi:hypothetical protein
MPKKKEPTSDVGIDAQLKALEEGKNLSRSEAIAKQAGETFKQAEKKSAQVTNATAENLKETAQGDRALLQSKPGAKQQKEQEDLKKKYGIK